MASERPFPPSARRLALARAAGLTPASPVLVGAAASIGAVVALAITGPALAAQLRAWVRAAVSVADGTASAGGVQAITGALAALALPVLGAISVAAVFAHLAQTRAVWLPRRRLPNAPVEDAQRGTRGALAIGNAVVIGAVTLAWLYAMAPRIAALVVVDRASAGALLVLSFGAALAIAWISVGAVDALVRFAGHVQSLRMSPQEQREDQRLAGADPRWRARRDKVARGEPLRDAIAGASVLVLGDGVAVAVAWDPVRRPVPTRTASGRAARATQLLGLARRHAIAVHRDPELATLLATGEGPVPERHWPQLAEIIAAVIRR